MIRETAVLTERKVEVINVTQQISDMVGDIENGLALFYLPHTTAALLVCEDESKLRSDLAHVAQNWLANCRPFKHIRRGNPNTEAHLLSAFGGTRLTVAIEEGVLDLGEYQNILLLEMDGPRQRRIRCKVVMSQGDP